MNLKVVVLAFGAMAACGGCANTRQYHPSGDPDQFFLITASFINEAEIAAGGLAHQRGSSEQVKDYGQRLVRDHTAANDQLKQLAAKKAVKLPNRPDELSKDMGEYLATLSGHEFDVTFVSAMAAGHTQAVMMFEYEAESAHDADVRAWARQTVPTLREHLQIAQQIKASLGAGGGGGEATMRTYLDGK